MSIESFIPPILEQFDVRASADSFQRLGSGYIHYTYKINGPKSYVLQRVNKNVFKKPEVISANIDAAANFLKANHPEFLFPTPLKSIQGRSLVWDEEGYPWRLFAYIPHTYTIDKVSEPNEAYSAAVAFSRLTKNLEGVDVAQFQPTIDRFHDLAWRYAQFEEALAQAIPARILDAGTCIDDAKRFQHLVSTYTEVIRSKKLKLRVTHNDTKINNVLFDARTREAVCAIDLDTLMPGYFIYDLGDMIRTGVSPVDEDEQDLSLIQIRNEIYTAIVDGYLSEMKSVLSTDELTLVHFSGQMMTYIMALRFLADHLNGNIYYQVKYPEHNLVRAKNQFRLLQLLSDRAA